ncbi:MAG: hypothetical protein M3R14_10415, partial [Acidobacteriota bacterium]|nr:hypothetical protein [Acidobacteriota bacterium]
RGRAYFVGSWKNYFVSLRKVFRKLQIVAESFQEVADSSKIYDSETSITSCNFLQLSENFLKTF